MKAPYLATEYAMCTGVGVSAKRLSSFDKALLDAGVGNYNLVRLSSILPAKCVQVPSEMIKEKVQEGSLLPVAYATISSSAFGERIASAIAVGLPVNKENVGVIMEYSDVNISGKEAEQIVIEMVREAFEERGWELEEVKSVHTDAVVEKKGSTVSTFACIAEW